jgi:hypothetical protein
MEFQTKTLEGNNLPMESTVIENGKEDTIADENSEELLSDANTLEDSLQYMEQIEQFLRQQLDEPDDGFVEFFFRRFCPNHSFRGQLKENFSNLVRRSLDAFLWNEFDNLIVEVRRTHTALRKANRKPPLPQQASEQPTPLEPTKIEREGFYIVRSILWRVVDPDRVCLQKSTHCCQLLLDGQPQKPLCRLYLRPGDRGQLGIPRPANGEWDEAKFSLDSLNDLYRYAEQLKSIAILYTSLHSNRIRAHI